MCHGVVQSKKCVCKCHSCHTGCVCHLLSGLRIICTIVVRSRQILKYCFCCLEGKSVCVIRRHNRYICLNCMSHNIDTRCTSQSFWLSHHVIYIYNCHVRKKLIICNWPFYTCLGICNNSKWCHLGTCSGRSRDCYKVSFLAHFRESEYTLADVHEVHGHVFEVSFRMLIHYPHNLCCVHGRSTAKSNNRIWLKCAHLIHTFFSTLKCRIRCHLEEACVLDSKLIQFLLDRSYVTILI